jgi:DNA-binding transcriptional LysR family regulator
VSAATDAFDKLDGDLPLEGTLRIASTVEHGQYVLPPIVATFLSRFPNIDVDLVLGDSFVDLVDRGIDLAVRVGSPGPSPHYISRKIAEMEYRLYGHRTLVDGAPYLRSPEDAAKLPWLLNSGSPERGRWTFEKDGAEIAISVSGRVISNAFSTRIEIAKHGGHLIGIPNFVPQKALGPNLVHVLKDFRIVPRHPIYAVYPDARFLSPKVLAFLDLLRERHP